MNKLTNNSEKLNFIIKHLNLKGDLIAKDFGLGASYISKMRNHYDNTLKDVHLYAFENCYGIPMRIFKDDTISTEAEIIAILDEHKECNDNDIFYKNKRLLANLEGDWYAYFYPSNSFANIHSIKTTIFGDGRVVDENKNFGHIHIGKVQSIIIKQAHNSKNLISLTFDNQQVAYGMFSFTLVSKSNHINQKMCNFGFFSKKQLELDIVKTILGDIENMQLKINGTFENKICDYLEMVGYA